MLYQINKEAFEALSEDLQKEYTLEGDSATLKIEGEGAPTPEALTRAEDKLRIEREHRKKAEDARDAAERQAEKFREDLDNATGKEEIAKIKAEHQAELERIRSEREAEQTAARETKIQQMKREEAKAFAEEHFTIPSVMVDQFEKRLSVEEIDGELVVRPLNPEGKASALSLNELKQEFLDNKEFSPIIKAKPGSGGGANPSGGGGATTKTLSEMTGLEEVEFANANPEEYARLTGTE